MRLEPMNAAQRDGEQKRTTPTVNPGAWSGQMEIVEDPYLAKKSRKIETGFRGRDIRAIGDKPSKH